MRRWTSTGSVAALLYTGTTTETVLLGGIGVTAESYRRVRAALSRSARYRLRRFAIASSDPPAGNETPRRMSQRSAVSSERPTRFIHPET